MKNKYKIKYFPKARIKFNDFFYNLDKRMKSLSDNEAVNFLKRCKKIRIISQLMYLLYFILLKSGLINLVSPNFYVIFFVLFSFVFIVLFALLYGLEAANSGSPFLIYKKNEESQLSELTLKHITREKFINFFMFIGVILTH